MNIIQKSDQKIFELTVFDLDFIEKVADEQSKKYQIDAFGDYLREHGFAGIKVEGIKDIVEKTYQFSQKYFAMDEDKKNLDKLSSVPSGYIERHAEKLSNLNSGDEKKFYDFKESFLFNGALRSPPKADIDFDDIAKFHDRMTDLSNRILTILEDYLEVGNSERTLFNAHTVFSVTRLVWYPSAEPEEDSRKIWCAPHFDISPFALLPKATASGLQMEKDGIWYNVEVPNDTVIFNTGRIFESLTAKMIKPTNHRVIADENSAPLGRFSIIHFPSWDTNYVVKPWSSCIQKTTELMNEEEKANFEKSLLKGNLEQLFKIYASLAGITKLQDHEIKELMLSLPDNEDIKSLAALSLKEKS